MPGDARGDVWKAVRLVQDVVDDRVDLHVVGDVARAVGNQHVTVRVFDDLAVARKRLRHGLEVPAGIKDCIEGKWKAYRLESC